MLTAVGGPAEHGSQDRAQRRRPDQVSAAGRRLAGLLKGSAQLGIGGDDAQETGKTHGVQCVGGAGSGAARNSRAELIRAPGRARITAARRNAGRV